MTPSGDNAVFCMVNLDPRNRQECTYEVPLWQLGLSDDGAVEVEDLLLGYKFELRGKTHRIALDPAERSVVIWRLRRPARLAAAGARGSTARPSRSAYQARAGDRPRRQAFRTLPGAPR